MTELRFRINQTKVIMAAREYKELWEGAYDDVCGKYLDIFNIHETLKQSREKLFRSIDRLNGGPEK